MTDHIMFDYELRGRIVVPDGSTLTDTGTGIRLPDGTIIKIWEQIEANYETNLSYDELEPLGIFYDGDCCEFTGPVDDGDRIWPPR